jgi:dephospho-CoA kinase
MREGRAADGAAYERHIDETPQIIGLVGHIGSGKTSIATYLESLGYARVTLSEFLRREASRRGLEPGRQQLQDLGDELRRIQGGGVLVLAALRLISDHGWKRAVIDGIRNPDEVGALREAGRSTLIAVTRPQSIPTGEDVEALRREMDDAAPSWGQRVAASIALADVVIENNGTLEQLRRKVNALVDRKPTARA